MAKRFDASLSEAAYTQFQDLCETSASMGLEASEKVLGLRRHPKRRAPIFKTAAKDARIYSNYFADVITVNEGKREIGPMRYRLRPKGSKKEIPTKYNVYNARLDSLVTKQTWNTIFMKNHGLLPFIQFFEWVKEKGRPKEVIFTPDHFEIMWAPCLWDEWVSQDGSMVFRSFALITDDPPKEITQRGHDRCPIFLKEDLIDEWLSPKDHTEAEMLEILKIRENTYFNHSWVA